MKVRDATSYAHLLIDRPENRFSGVREVEFPSSSLKNSLSGEIRLARVSTEQIEDIKSNKKRYGSWF